MGVAVVVLLALMSVLGLYGLLHASLPELDNDIVASQLSAPATVERDRSGVPTVRASTRVDLAFATGYVHGQDRFFQMDLQRRLAAGELAELIGPAAASTDRDIRRHQFTRVADEVLDRLSAAERQLLEAYAAGVNLAVEHLGARPWEYFPLGSKPRPWQPRDSLLVAFAMYLDLNDTSGERELANAALRSTLPAEILAVLNPLGSEWDAPVDGGTWRLPQLPGPEILDLRSAPAKLAALSVPPSVKLTERTGDAAFGSNSWAVSGSLTTNGAALLANDMHLGLQVPNIWYRARLIVESKDQKAARDLIGVTLPGLPILVVGSNGHVAWGFTNTHGDWTDLVAVEVDPADRNRYFTADGSAPFESSDEVIRIRNQPSETMTVTRTVWGPVIARDANGKPLALAWTAQRPEATNLKMLKLEAVSTVEEALQAANESGAPVQNFVAADSQGHIGWTFFGQIPVREGYDSRYPSAWSKPATGWTGWRRPEEYPRVVDPLNGRLWTANTRTIDATTWLAFAGPGSHVLGARAGQIRDGLLALKSPTAADMIAIQLDDRALFLARWRDLLLQLLDAKSLDQHADRQAARTLVEKWSGHAAVDDAGYRIVRNFRRAVLTGTFDPLVAPAKLAHPDIEFEPGQQFEGPAWQLVTERPLHLLDPRYDSWEQAMLAWLDKAVLDLKTECGELSACNWGEGNRLAMRHPLSRALPFLSRLLDMPRDALPGDSNMPRVQSPRQGASERLVVSPGRESEGYFQMPGGQSSHPLSPYYRAGHEAWVTGEPQPLLPGKAEHSLRLVPRHQD